jgi:hypothetical protein
MRQGAGLKPGRIEKESKMRIVNQSSEALERIKDVPLTPGNERMHKYQDAAAQIRAELNAPIELWRCDKIDYDTKTDRYVATFGHGNDKTAKVKATNAVAQFLITHYHEAGYWIGRMEDGTLVDAYLIVAS